MNTITSSKLKYRSSTCNIVQVKSGKWRQSPRVAARTPKTQGYPQAQLIVRKTGSKIPQRVVKQFAESQARYMQDKDSAFWFYRFLSQVYDVIVNPWHWTVEMRKQALEPALLSDPSFKVVDVGGGTGFASLGIVDSGIPPANITLLDQSPHQMSKAKKKDKLKGVTFVEGDAENLPFAADSFDRYVSAGSIEYWPNPATGIQEAYRVVKPGATACVIGPVYPTNPICRFFADIWMLFPTEDEYMKWFTEAGFDDVSITRIGPSWYRGARQYGLIMGCSVTGVKTKAGPPTNMSPPAPAPAKKNPLSFLVSFILGNIGGLFYFFLPIFLFFKSLVWPKSWAM